MRINPYLFFEGRCEEAIAFYQKTLGAKLEMLTRYSEYPEQTPEMLRVDRNKVMHASLDIRGNQVYCSDGFCSGQPVFQGFSLTISVNDQAEAKRLFDALGEGGQVGMPLAKSFFSPCFGMLKDRFGLGWMIIVPAEG